MNWTPRPPRPDEPACWSWPLPDVVHTREDEIRRLMTGPDPLSRGAADLVLRGLGGWVMLSWHDDRCAGCGRRGEVLVDDHDHFTGKIRGYLCHGCNIREGLDSSDVLALYRQAHPAAILGIDEWYVGRGWPQGWWRRPAVAYSLTGNPSFLTPEQRAEVESRPSPASATLTGWA